ncbi:hypothetical protein GCM10017083_02350 [Thalassobaculum fulvum]|uniref:Uncharacterized protein n=1 Tax=Thalassobaculum fulvum TaxID=1633335 RepID=A0A918XMM8_9PROT|nr:hypothetical protein GCM10017083_02350 [Thalassobaculum fulvum]
MNEQAISTAISTRNPVGPRLRCGYTTTSSNGRASAGAASEEAGGERLMAQICALRGRRSKRLDIAGRLGIL